MPAPRRSALPQEQQQAPAAGHSSSSSHLAPAPQQPSPGPPAAELLSAPCSPRERRHSLGGEDEGTEDVTELLLLYIQFPT